MNLADKLTSGFSAESQVLIGLIKTEAERLRLPLYIVGGSVRDLILGRGIKDLDLTVEGNSGALAEAIMKKYGGHITVQARFGTATWTLNESTLKRLNVPAFLFSSPTVSFDLISARYESYEYPGALPTVKFSTIDDDLRRRDFTVNALAIRLDGVHYGMLTDPVQGYADLENRIIRALHARSFVDDPTRIFRALRYAVRYDFGIASDTLNLINNQAFDVLSRLSGERLRHEFDLIFDEQDAGSILEQLIRLRVLEVIHPSLHMAEIRHLLMLTDQPLPEVGELLAPELPSFRQTLGWVLFLLNLPDGDVETISKRLTFPATLTKAARGASSLNTNLASFRSWRPSQWTLRLEDVPAMSVYAVYLANNIQELRDYLTTWRNVKPYTTGYILQQRGLTPGPKFKEILTHLRMAWLDGEVNSEYEEKALLERLISSARRSGNYS
jgi:tRNA nucleotidyltransferase (CCA-adding enzyme)